MTTTTLSVTFRVPTKQIKNSNAALGHIVSAQRSAWLRSYAEPVWAAALQEQHGLVAVEPQESDLPTYSVTPEAQEVLDSLEELQEELRALEAEEAALQQGAEAQRERKALLRKLKKEGDPQALAVLEEEIFRHEEALVVVKAGKKRVRATLASTKRLQLPAVHKEVRRLESQKRKAYIAKKLELNSHQQLFQKCAVVVRVHNISKHLYDSPNFWPTAKALLDGGTDTGVLWPDDNNTVIQGGTLFLPGENKERDHYVFEVEVLSEWPWEA